MKKLLSYSLVVTLLVLFTGGGFLFYRISQFRAKVSELKADGQPVSFLDLSDPVAIGQPNAKDPLNRLKQPLASFEEEMFADQDALFQPVDDKMIARFHEIDQAYPDVFPLIDQALSSNRLEIALLGSYDEVLQEYLSESQQLRSCARVMSWKMRILAAEGMPDEAVELGIDILRLCRMYDSHPALVSQLVRIASRGIAIQALHELVVNAPITDDVRGKLNSELERSDKMSDYRKALVSERAFGIEMLSDQSMLHIAMSGVGYLEYLRSEIENADKEGFERDLSFEGDFSSVTGGVLTGMMIPAIAQTRSAVDRARSWIRALRIINGLVAKPVEAEGMEEGVTKARLAALGIPESMMIDTINGELMKIKRANDEWVVYSVGANGVDDGGSHVGIEDYVLGGEDNDDEE